MIYQYKKSIPNINFLIVKKKGGSNLIVDQFQEWDEKYQIYKNQKFKDITNDPSFVNINSISKDEKRFILSKIFYLRHEVIQ